MKNDIPKVIHYCWFGNNKKSKLIEKCINSWKEKCPDYEIVEWNENNFDININNYVREAYENKKWAFVTDYARLWIVYNYGGIYLDTDVELLKSLNTLLTYKEFFCFEKKDIIATGLGFGAIRKSKIVKKMMDSYNNINFIKEDGTLDLTPCPVRNMNDLEKVFGELHDNSEITIINDTAFLPKDFFCPYDVITGTLKTTKNTYAIHWYDSSWIKNRKMNKIKSFFARKIKKVIGVETFNKLFKRK